MAKAQSREKNAPHSLISIIIMICIGALVFLPLFTSSQALAVSAYFGDEIGNTEINVEVDEEFAVVLWVVDAVELAAYDCKITINGPATAIGQAAHGDWFADGHTVFDGLTTIPADYRTAMLSSPTDITGSGDIVVFTLHADDDGVVAINVDTEYFFLADTNGRKMYLLEPSTLYVTIGTGEGLSEGTGEGQDEGGEDEYDSSDFCELDDPPTWWLSVDSWRYVSEEEHYNAEDAVIIADPKNIGDTTLYVKQVADGLQVTLTAPLAYYSSDANWSGWLAFHHWRTCLAVGGTTDHPIGQRTITFVCKDGDSWACAIYREEILWVDPADENAFSTIQAAIDAVPEWSEDYSVVVVPGTYQGEGNRNLDFSNGLESATRTIRLYSRDGAPSTCTIQCGEQKGFYFHAGETRDCVVSGLKITGGSNAIWCESSSPTIYGNEITNNTAGSSGDGAGIHCSGGSPLIKANTITSNSARYGGGIYCLNSSAEIINNTIGGATASVGNSAVAGGGIYCRGNLDDEPPQIKFNAISSNLATSDHSILGGGGIFCTQVGSSSSPFLIEGNSIIGNQAIRTSGPNGCRASGGGILCSWIEYGGEANMSYINVRSNTIRKNIAKMRDVQNARAIGAGVCLLGYSYYPTRATIAENVFYENYCNWNEELEGDGGALYIELSRILGISKNTFTGNKAQGHAAGIYAENVIGNPKCDPYDDMPEPLQGTCSEIRLEGNTFRENEAGEYCAAQFYRSSPVPYCRVLGINNTVVANKAFREDRRAGGFSFNNYAAYLINCTFKGNMAYNVGHSIYFYPYVPTYFVTLRMVNCIVHNGDEPPTTGLISAENPTVLYSAIQEFEPDEDLHIINDNPRYADKYGKLWPYEAGTGQQPSPCIDSGTSDVNDPGTTGEGWVESLPAVDVRGNDRILAGQSEGDPVIDMGAFEMKTYTQQEEHIWPLPGDADWSCRVNILDLIVIRNLLNQSPSDGTNWKKDVNQDSKINVLDLIYVRNHIALQCD